MTGYYVLTNIMGGRPDDPTPEQIATYCKSFQEGTSELDRPAWDEADYYARLGFKTTRIKDGFRVAAEQVEVKTYGGVCDNRTGDIIAWEAGQLRGEADFGGADEKVKRTGGRERASAWAFDIHLGK